MNKKSLWLLLLGSVLMGATLFLSHITEVPYTFDLVTKSSGVILMIIALIIHKKRPIFRSQKFNK